MTGPEARGCPTPLNAEEVVEVETDVGTIYLHADDEVMTPLISRDKTWEADEGAFLARALRRGDTFLDVGANVGYMSILAGRAVGERGRLLAVEPERRNLALLRANLWRNGLSADVFPVAAYSRTGFLRLVCNESNRGDHRVFEAGVGPELVPCARLDDLLGQRRLDIVKIDTQGADHEVLDGMRRLIAANPALTVITEFWLEGLEERAIDPASVLAGYRDLSFNVSLLDAGGVAREVSDSEAIAACDEPGRFVNLVLRRPGRMRRRRRKA